MASENDTEEENKEFGEFDYDDLEKQLADQLAGIDFIDEQKKQIGSPDALGNVVLDTVWEQFTNQIAIQAGEDFIRENNGLKLDLRDEAHIQTTENFAEGKIASHNTEVDYQQRYDKWQSNFQRDGNGKIITHKSRTGKDETTLVAGARKPFDKDRPTGNKEKKTDMDHTISAAEIIRDPAANAHMTKEEQIAFANSKENLNELDSSLNRSKGEKSMSDWLDNPNANGQKPDEIFDISESDKQKLREKGKEADDEFNKKKGEGEEKSIKSGKKSQKAEALRVGKNVARTMVMNLLAELVKKIIQKFVAWLKSSSKELKTLLGSIKDAVEDFIFDLKTNVVNVADSVATVIATSIVGPVVNTIKKVWIMLKQGWQSLKEAIAYIRDPKNKKQPIGITMLEVGKIVIAGITAAGAIGLGEVIETGLTSIPIFAFEIPMFGSLANIIGIFMGAVVAGIIGALAIDLINRIIAKKQKQALTVERIDKANAALATQGKILDLKKNNFRSTKNDVVSSIYERHEAAAYVMKQSIENIANNDGECNGEEFRKINKKLDSLIEEDQ